MRESSAFRRCIILLLQAIIIVAQTYTFWHFWDTYYSEGLTRMFFFKGHIVIVFLYALLFGVFANVYGAFQISRLRFGDMVFSQILSFKLYITSAVIHLHYQYIDNIFLCYI